MKVYEDQMKKISKNTKTAKKEKYTNTQKNTMKKKSTRHFKKDECQE